MPGIQYWRIQAEPRRTGPARRTDVRAVPDLNGWMLFAQVDSLDRNRRPDSGAGRRDRASEDRRARTAWVTVYPTRRRTFSGIWQADPSAFPIPEPD